MKFCVGDIIIGKPNCGAYGVTHDCMRCEVIAEITSAEDEGYELDYDIRVRTLGGIDPEEAYERGVHRFKRVSNDEVGNTYPVESKYFVFYDDVPKVDFEIELMPEVSFEEVFM